MRLQLGSPPSVGDWRGSHAFPKQNFVWKRKDVLSQFAKMEMVKAYRAAMDQCGLMQPHHCPRPERTLNSLQSGTKHAGRDQNTTPGKTPSVCAATETTPCPQSQSLWAQGLVHCYGLERTTSTCRAASPWPTAPAHTLTPPVKEGAVQQRQPTANTPSHSLTPSWCCPGTQPWCRPALHPQLRQPSPCIRQLCYFFSSQSLVAPESAQNPPSLCMNPTQPCHTSHYLRNALVRSVQDCSTSHAISRLWQQTNPLSEGLCRALLPPPSTVMGLRRIPLGRAGCPQQTHPWSWRAALLLAPAQETSGMSQPGVRWASVTSWWTRGWGWQWAPESTTGLRLGALCTPCPTAASPWCSTARFAPNQPHRSALPGGLRGLPFPTPLQELHPTASQPAALIAPLPWQRGCFLLGLGRARGEN